MRREEEWLRYRPPHDTTHAMPVEMPTTRPMEQTMHCPRLYIALVTALSWTHCAAAQGDSPDLKKLKLFPEQYEGKTLVLKNVH
jgi:hypothetical protein